MRGYWIRQGHTLGHFNVGTGCKYWITEVIELDGIISDKFYCIYYNMDDSLLLSQTIITTSATNRSQYCVVFLRWYILICYMTSMKQWMPPMLHEHILLALCECEFLNKRSTIYSHYWSHCNLYRHCSAIVVNQWSLLDFPLDPRYSASTPLQESTRKHMLSSIFFDRYMYLNKEQANMVDICYHYIR